VRTVTDKLPDLLERYSSFIDFLAVYITEAHAKDEWPAGKRSSCTQPTTNQERTDLAKALFDSRKLSIPMLVDPIENGFEKAFAAWPIRFYIVHGGKVLFKSQPDGIGYNLRDVLNCLDDLKSKISRGTKRRM